MGLKVKFNVTIIEKIVKSNAPTIICNLSKKYLESIFEISDETISLNLILAQNLLKFKEVLTNEKAYFEVAELPNIHQMFPFDFVVSHELLHNSDCFSLNNFGGKIVLVKE